MPTLRIACRSTDAELGLRNAHHRRCHRLEVQLFLGTCQRRLWTLDYLLRGRPDSRYSCFWARGNDSETPPPPEDSKGDRRRNALSVELFLSAYQERRGCGLWTSRCRVSPSLLGPADPLFRALSGSLKFTVRHHKFNKDYLMYSDF